MNHYLNSRPLRRKLSLYARPLKIPLRNSRKLTLAALRHLGSTIKNVNCDSRYHQRAINHLIVRQISIRLKNLMCVVWYKIKSCNSIIHKSVTKYYLQIVRPSLTVPINIRKSILRRIAARDCNRRLRPPASNRS